MFLAETSAAEILEEAFESAFPESFFMGLKIFWDALVQCAIDYPLLAVIVVVLIFLNHRKKK